MWSPGFSCSLSTRWLTLSPAMLQEEIAKLESRGFHADRREAKLESRKMKVTNIRKSWQTWTDPRLAQPSTLWTHRCISHAHCRPDVRCRRHVIVSAAALRWYRSLALARCQIYASARSHRREKSTAMRSLGPGAPAVSMFAWAAEPLADWINKGALKKKIAPTASWCNFFFQRPLDQPRTLQCQYLLWQRSRSFFNTKHRRLRNDLLIWIFLFIFFHSSQTPVATGRTVGLSGGGARYTFAQVLWSAVSLRFHSSSGVQMFSIVSIIKSKALHDGCETHALIFRNQSRI